MFGIIIGRLVKDVEYTPAQSQNGKARANFTVAVDRPKKKNQQNQNQQTADFYDCTAWGNTADVLNNNYVKGDVVVADDVKYEANQYQDKQGQTRTKHQWIVNHVVPAYSLVSKRQVEALYTQNQQRQQNAGNVGYGVQGGYQQPPVQAAPQMAQPQYQQPQPQYGQPVYAQNQYYGGQPAQQTTQYGQPIYNLDDTDVPY